MAFQHFKRETENYTVRYLISKFVETYCFFKKFLLFRVNIVCFLRYN